jgi:hypothetical protein
VTPTHDKGRWRRRWPGIVGWTICALGTANLIFGWVENVDVGLAMIAVGVAYLIGAATAGDGRE